MSTIAPDASQETVFQKLSGTSPLKRSGFSVDVDGDEADTVGVTDIETSPYLLWLFGFRTRWQRPTVE